MSLGAGGIGVGNALIDEGERAVFVPIEACRLVDTRPAQGVSGRNTRLGDNEAFTIDVDEAVGECAALGDATGLSLNVTPVGPTSPTYLSFVPGELVPPTDGSRYDDSSNLNPDPSQPPTPNAVEVDLDAEQRFSVYNAFGSVDVVIDIVGYYEDHHHDDRYYTKSETTTLIAGSVIDAYTKAEADSTIASAIDALDVYSTEETDDAIAEAVDGLSTGSATLPPPRQATTANVVITDTNPVLVVGETLNLSALCSENNDRYIVRVDITGYVNFEDAFDAIDAEMDLRINGTQHDEAHLEVQLQDANTSPDSGILPEIPFSRSVVVPSGPGLSNYEWVAELESALAGGYEVRDTVMIVTPVHHTCLTVG